MKEKEIKCLIWDLDHTIWDGILSEEDSLILKPEILTVLKQLDERGILQSVASKNNFEDGWNKLIEFGIEHYFLYPQINWNAKSVAVANIVGQLNISMDTVAFIDDQIFERDEVKSACPDVECIDALNYHKLLLHKRFCPRFITEDSVNRRKMYQDDYQRQVEEAEYSGPKDDFLADLGLNFIISQASDHDLKRAEELTIRTNQLNATGVTYSLDDLSQFLQSADYNLLVCELTDRYGSYGKIGLSLIEKGETVWKLRMLLMSCRVMSRGVGTVLLGHIMQEAHRHGVKLQADFKATQRNRMMYITYKFANFYEVANDGDGNIVFENDLSRIPELPAYINLNIK